ncbi:MAG: hypothetical protein QE487_18920 [Fluviicola sp.]|nr:hypothetical protein [Fluviicola sp.]
MCCTTSNYRFSCLKLMCVTITFVGSFLSVSAQTNPKQALVRYQLAQQHLPDYDSLRLDLELEIFQYDSILNDMETKLEKAYRRSMVCGASGCSAEKNRLQEDSLAFMQQEMMETEKTANLILTRKEIQHEEMLIKSFHQRSLEFCKARSLDLLLEAEPLYSKEPVVDLTNEFILFLEEYRKKK